MRKLFLLAMGIIALNSCNTEPKFQIKGEVADADGKTLYFESLGIGGVDILDSMKLKSEGSFSFKGVRPESPEFYRLRVEDKIINFSVDSTETVDIKADYKNFSTGYSVEGSENSSKIKELTLLQAGLQNKVNALVEAARTNKVTNDVFGDSIAALLNDYKDNVKVNYIFAAPNKSYAYFALFQKINDYLIFDPLNSKEDVKCFAAVATSLNNMYPHADRSKNLYNIAIKGMKNTRTPVQKTMEIPEDKINEAGVIDIDLKDAKGNVRKLSELKGKVVLLDFTVYQSAVSTPHNFMLRDLYDKYAARGLEIYQVSFDADEHFWRTTTDNLPWVCVRDANGIYSGLSALYNIQKLPAYFLVNRNNELSARDENIKDLEEAIKKLL